MTILVFEQGLYQAEPTAIISRELLHPPSTATEKPTFQGMFKNMNVIKKPSPQKDTLHNRRQLAAREIMISPVITAVSHDLVLQVTQSLLAANVSHVVAIDAEQHPIGIINISTLLATQFPDTRFIRQFCGSSVLAVQEHTLVRDIAAIFINYKATAICVVNQQHQLSGIICRVDLRNLLVGAPNK